MKLNKFTLAALAITSGLLLSACGGGDDPIVAATNTTAAINPTSGTAIVTAVSKTSFDFATGVSALGTTSATSVTLAAPTTSGGTPTFNVASTEGTATGDLAFGSCIFKIKTSTYPAAHPLAEGKTVTISPCELTVATSGTVADGAPTTKNVSMLLGTVASQPKPLKIVVDPTGTLAVNGTVIKTITVTVSGASN